MKAKPMFGRFKKSTGCSSALPRSDRANESLLRLGHRARSRWDAWTLIVVTSPRFPQKSCYAVVGMATVWWARSFPCVVGRLEHPLQAESSAEWGLLWQLMGTFGNGTAALPTFSRPKRETAHGVACPTPLKDRLFLGERGRRSRQIEQDIAAIMERGYGDTTRFGRPAGCIAISLPSLPSRSTTARSPSLGAVARFTDSISERLGPLVVGFVDLDIRSVNGVEREPVPTRSNMPIRTRLAVTSPPSWIKPELAALVKAAPDGPGWMHEIKLDGYRMHARLDAGRVQILTRCGNDWTAKYPTIAKALAELPTTSAYLDGELCGVLPDGRTAFNLIQNALEHGDASLVYFVFDLLFLEGEDVTTVPLVDRKARLEAFLAGAPDAIRYSDHQIGQGPEFYRIACQHGLEGIVSKRIDGRYKPDRRSWLKTKCLNREEFVVVGWSDPEGTRHRIGALLLGYYTPNDGKLIYAGRVGTGMPIAELERLYGRLQPLVVPKMPLSEPPPRSGRFGSPLVLSRVHWVRPKMVVEVSYVEMTPDGLLRHVVYLAEREDKPARDVIRSRPI